MKISITPHAPLVVPDKIGNGYEWRTPSGDVLTVTDGGWIEVNHDHEVTPTSAQWAEIAAVALYQQHRAAVREANPSEV